VLSHRRLDETTESASGQYKRVPAPIIPKGSFLENPTWSSSEIGDQLKH